MVASRGRAPHHTRTGGGGASLTSRTLETSRRSEREGLAGGPDADGLRHRLVDLESRVRALAVSRRVLINLLVSADKRRRHEVAALKVEVEKLRRRNARYEKALATRDAVIHRLRHRIEEVLRGGQDAGS